MTYITKAQTIKLLALDVDGVLTDGSLIYDSQGVEIKTFYVPDGLGIQALLRFGVDVALITGRNSPMVERRAKELGIRHVIQGQDDKLTALSHLANHLGLDLANCAYMGDDLIDVAAISQAGLGISVLNGCIEARQMADFIPNNAGGQGAVREVCMMILKAQGHYDDLLKQYGITQRPIVI